MSTLLLQLHSVAHGPLIVFTAHLPHDTALANLFIAVARVLLLLHILASRSMIAQVAFGPTGVERERFMVWRKRIWIDRRPARL